MSRFSKVAPQMSPKAPRGRHRARSVVAPASAEEFDMAVERSTTTRVSLQSLADERSRAAVVSQCNSMDDLMRSYNGILLDEFMAGGSGCFAHAHMPCCAMILHVIWAWRTNLLCPERGRRP